MEFGGIAIVVLNVPPKADMTENVFGVTKDCRIAWQIERTPVTSSDPVNTYVGVSPNDADANSAWITNWNCTAVLVDVRTGRVLGTEITK